MDFTPVPAAKQADIKVPKRAAWFNALLEHGMLEMQQRPNLSPSQKDVLEAQGQRFRSRVVDERTYVWVEDIPAPDLNEADIPLPADYDEENV